MTGIYQDDIIIAVGLPLSGKSTMIDQIKKQPWSDHYTIVCPDDVRLALSGNEFHFPAEKFVWATVDLMARSLLIRGQKIIVDATNKTKWERNQWVKLAKEFDASYMFLVEDTPADECIKRARADNREEMVEVIENMAEKFEPLDEEELKTIYIRKVVLKP
jgi:predicted kinase